MADLIDFLFGRGEELFLKVTDEPIPAPVPWPIGFRLEVYDSAGNHLGNVCSRARSAFNTRMEGLFYGGNFPFEAAVTNRSGGEMMHIERQGLPMLATETSVISASGICLGSVRQHLTFFTRRMELQDSTDDYASLKIPSKERAIFPFQCHNEKVTAGVAFHWEGTMHQLFSSKEYFSVYFGKTHWSPAQRCVFLSAGIALAMELLS